MFEQYRLKNKLNVVLVPQRDTLSTTFLVMYPVGSRYETEKMNGVSHYIEHLMFKGTKKRKNTLVLTREIDRLGAEYNAFTGKEYTAYYIKVDAKYAKTAIDILDDMLHHSVFDPREMEREKPVIVEELSMYRDNPMINIENIFEDLMFAGCSLGRDIGGTAKHVLGFERDDVLAFKEKYYQPKNATFVIAGHIPETLRGHVETFFGSAENTKPSSKRFTPARFGSAKKQDRIVVEHKATEQAQMMLGFPAFERGNPKNAAVSVLNTILGGSMSSRLFIQIRERKGLAYMVRSSYDTFHDVGYSFIRAGLDPKNMNRAIALIKQELQKISTKKVSLRELRDAKTHMHGSLTLSMEDSSSLANWYAREAVLFDQIETPQQWLEQVEAVTQDDILSVARQIFRWNELRIAIIGNVKTEQIIF